MNLNKSLNFILFYKSNSPTMTWITSFIANDRKLNKTWLPVQALYLSWHLLWNQTWQTWLVSQQTKPIQATRLMTFRVNYPHKLTLVSWRRWSMQITEGKAKADFCVFSAMQSHDCGYVAHAYFQLHSHIHRWFYLGWFLLH